MFKSITLACLAATSTALSLNQSESLAQVFLEAGTQGDSTCTNTQDRAKAGSVDFYKLLYKESKFTDSDFKADYSSLDWAEWGEQELYNKRSIIEWGRAQDVFPGKTIFGNGISADDINQGGLGNCWFLSAISAIAEKPGRMEKVFLNKQNYQNKAGIYGFQFHSLGVPHTVVIDDYLPLQTSGSTKKTVFTKLGDDNSLWGALIEKAFAKYWGNYGHIVGGDPALATRTILGTPWEKVKHNEKSVDELWEFINGHANTDNILTAGTKGNNDSYTNYAGLVEGHAYTVIKTVTLSNGTRLVQCRNPWGSDSFKGDWSDQSTKWTTTYAAEAGFTKDQEDGFIFMTIDDFHSMFESSSLNYDPDNLSKAHFLRLDDDGTGAEIDGRQMRHWLTLTSDVDQTIWVSANTWDQRAMPDRCANTSGDYHGFLPDWGNTNYIFRYGSFGLPSYKIRAGRSHKLRFDANFGANDAKDWSVVVYGSNKNGTLSLTHSKGL